jgi:pyruvate/2-oxoglutarate dehydrogenase complex dihydrolipoamide acyltransferase (E2) component
MSAVEVRFPAMSRDDPEAQGIVGTWFVHDGQVVSAGQIIAEIQVEKVSQDVTAPTAGVVRLLVAVEEPVRQGDLIATVDT